MTASAPPLGSRIEIPGSLYLVILALLGPFMSPWSGIWGETANVGSVAWRYGVFGQVVLALYYPFLALAVTALIAARRGERRVLLAVAAVSVVLALLVAAGLGPFALDFLELKRTLNPPSFRPLKDAGYKVMAMSLLAIPGFLLMARHAWVAARESKTVPPRVRPSPLVGGAR